jgi:tRNA(Ile)-lysidine synthase
MRSNIKIPANATFAVSGGPDSMILAEFYRRLRVPFSVVHVNHGTGKFADDSEELVRGYCAEHLIPLHVQHLSLIPIASKERQWRLERLKAYREASESFSSPCIITGHHLDDAVETWLFTSLRGHSQLIPQVGVRPYTNMKPFLTIRKSELLEWADRVGFNQFLVDPTNFDESNTRSIIRAEMSSFLRINPGLHTVIKKKYLA